MPNEYKPADQRTMYFIGVTTGKSSIMRVFPNWAAQLGLDAVIQGIDLPLHDEPERYREVVWFIKDDPLSLGALVTTHKIDLLQGQPRPVRRSRPLRPDPGRGRAASRSRAAGCRAMPRTRSPAASPRAILADGTGGGPAAQRCSSAPAARARPDLYLHDKARQGADGPPDRGLQPQPPRARRDAADPRSRASTSRSSTCPRRPEDNDALTAACPRARWW